MKIEKNISQSNRWFYYYYKDSKTGNQIYHGLYNDYTWWGISYYYHGVRKRFWLRRNYCL